MPQPSPVEIQELRLLMGSARDPEGRVFAQLGDALRRAGERYEARMILEEGLEQHPAFAPGHLSLAWVLLEDGELEAARAAFQRTLQLDDENPLGMYGLGLVLQSQGDESAEGYLDRARALHPGVEEASPNVSVEQVSLATLPYLSLEELAPEPAPKGDPLETLPFTALTELAPEPVAAMEATSPTAEALPELDVGAVSALEMPGDEALPASEPRAEDEDDATPVTRTMAELMVQQGHADRAVALYERLARENPGDASLQERLQELRRLADAPGTPAVDPGATDEGERVHPALSSPEPAPSEPTPFAWTEGGAEEGEEEPAAEGPSVGNYFGSLLGWSGEEDGAGRDPGSTGESGT